MEISTESLMQRIQALGFSNDAVSTSELTSPVAAVSCLPMYMVANMHAWTADSQWKMPLTDIPGFEAIREAFAIGRQEKKLGISDADRQNLGTFLNHARPADKVLYDHALHIIADYLSIADASVADQLRTAIARMVVAVAAASGEGFLGTGEKINRHEVRCINEIAEKLDLRKSQGAVTALKAIDD